MKENSKIIVVNSNKTSTNSKLSAAYCASKAALHSFLQNAKAEASKLDIDLIEAIFDESTYADCSKDKIRNFYRDAAKQIIIAINPLSNVNHQELHLGCSSYRKDEG